MRYSFKRLGADGWHKTNAVLRGKVVLKLARCGKHGAAGVGGASMDFGKRLNPETVDDGVIRAVRLIAHQRRHGRTVEPQKLL